MDSLSKYYIVSEINLLSNQVKVKPSNGNSFEEKFFKIFISLHVHTTIHDISTDYSNYSVCVYDKSSHFPN